MDACLWEVQTDEGSLIFLTLSYLLVVVLQVSIISMIIARRKM